MTVHHAAQVDALQARDVAELVQARAWPSVTLLLDTTPADRILVRDAERLQSLLEDAERQLTALDVPGTDIRRQLRVLVADASCAATGRGLAIFASQAVQRIYRLPVQVAAGAVVERTFRTRDLVHTLHRTPPYLLLVLNPTCAQLYRGYGDTMIPLTNSGFPIQHTLPQLGSLEGGDDRLDDFMSSVDRSLARARQRHPAPIVVAGDRKPVSRFVRRSRNLQRLAGVITDPSLDTVQLYAAVRASLEEYLLSREEEALLVLDQARSQAPQSVYSGVHACWEAARAAVPATLLVEEGYFFPAVVDDQGVRRLDWPSTPEGTTSGARSDLIDDLIEVVIDRGGWVAFTHNDRLDAYGRVALVTVASSRTDDPAGVSAASPLASAGLGTPPP